MDTHTLSQLPNTHSDTCSYMHTETHTLVDVHTCSHTCTLLELPILLPFPPWEIPPSPVKGLLSSQFTTSFEFRLGRRTPKRVNGSMDKDLWSKFIVLMPVPLQSVWGAVMCYCVCHEGTPLQIHACTQIINLLISASCISNG